MNNNIVWQVFHQVFFDQEKGTWECHDCSRKVQVTPEYKVINKGDESATHGGSYGGLTIGSLAVTKDDN